MTPTPQDALVIEAQREDGPAPDDPKLVDRPYFGPSPDWYTTRIQNPDNPCLFPRRMD